MKSNKVHCLRYNGCNLLSLSLQIKWWCNIIMYSLKVLEPLYALTLKLEFPPNDCVFRCMPSIIIMASTDETHNESKSTNHNWQIWSFKPVKVRFCFLQQKAFWHWTLFYFCYHRSQCMSRALAQATEPSDLDALRAYDAWVSRPFPSFKQLQILLENVSCEHEFDLPAESQHVGSQNTTSFE